MRPPVTREMGVSILTTRAMHIASTCSKRHKIPEIASIAMTMTMVGLSGVSTGIRLSTRTKNTESQ